MVEGIFRRTFEMMQIVPLEFGELIIMGLLVVNIIFTAICAVSK